MDVVVGSAICKEIKKSISKRQNPVTNVTNMVIEIEKIRSNELDHKNN